MILAAFPIIWFDIMADIVAPSYPNKNQSAMKKRKVLWFCGAQFSDEKIKTTGTWLIAMGNALAKTSDLELYNVTYGDVKTITRKDSQNITQWIIPHEERIKYHQGSKELVSFIKRINDEIQPGLIHVWGTENGFGFAVKEANLDTPMLLEIQGLLFAYVKFYYGGLTTMNLINSIGLKEILKPANHLYFIRREFKKKGKHEICLIQQMENISVQSDWVHSIIKFLTPKSTIFHTGMMLRGEFHEAIVWEHPRESETINIFTSCSGPIPYKGLHVIFEAIAILKNKYPNIKLNIGGDIQVEKKYGLIRDGYTGWMLKKARELGIEDSISWLGMMSADEMINEMHRSSMVVIPSFVETYCLFMAESMLVGVPSIASYAGSLPQLAEHDKSALYFPMGDHWSCARQIERIITDPELAKKISTEARSMALQRNNQTKVLQTQLGIYDKIINA